MRSDAGEPGADVLIGVADEGPRPRDRQFQLRGDRGDRHLVEPVHLEGPAGALRQFGQGGGGQRQPLAVIDRRLRGRARIDNGREIIGEQIGARQQALAAQIVDTEIAGDARKR